MAFAKNSITDQWYEFNDSSVSMINESSVCSSAAYVLFYRRRDLPTADNINFAQIQKKPHNAAEGIEIIGKAPMVMSSEPYVKIEIDEK